MIGYLIQTNFGNKDFIYKSDYQPEIENNTVTFRCRKTDNIITIVGPCIIIKAT